MATLDELRRHAQNPNVRRFLDVISQAEGTTGYDTAFGGGKIESLADHPRTLHDFTQTDGKANKTSAAGRYQFLRGTWDDVAGRLGLPDFGAESQDLAAIELLRRNGSLEPLLAGDFDTAIQRSGSTWASLPSSPYAQPKRSEGFISQALDGAAGVLLPSARATTASNPFDQFDSQTLSGAPGTSENPFDQFDVSSSGQGSAGEYSRPDGSMRIDMSHGGPTEATEDQRRRASAPMRFAQGLTDPITGGAQFLVNSLPESVVDTVNAGAQAINDIPYIGRLAEMAGIRPMTAPQMNEQIAADERAYQGARSATGQEGMDWWRLGGNVVGTLPLAAATAPAATGGALNMMGAGAAQGALFGGLQPVVDGPFAQNKLSQMAVGGAAGGAASALGQGISRLISPRASTNPQIQTLMDEGVTPTPGQMLGGTARSVEDKAMSVPILGDAIRGARNRGITQLNRAALNRAVEPLGRTVNATGRKGLEQVDDIIGQAYDDILPRLTFRADNQFAQEISRLRQMVQSMPDERIGQFDRILRDKVIGKLTPQGVADGRNFKAMESELGRLASGLMRAADVDQRELGMALRELQQSLRNTLQRTNPQASAELGKINQAYALFTRLQTAAGGAGATDGVFTPAQLSSAVRAADRSARKGAFARGDALMQDLSDAAKGVMPGTVPDSGTAGRLFLGGLSAWASPGTAMSLGAASVPYLPGINRLAAIALGRRPEFAPRIAEAVSQGFVPAPLVAGPLANQVFGQ